jgi:RNA polymerase sigma factor (sigma-70 family)
VRTADYDIISEGNVGLVIAVRRFDPEKGFRLATYAMWWIRAASRLSARDQVWMRAALRPKLRLRPHGKGERPKPFREHVYASHVWYGNIGVWREADPKRTGDAFGFEFTEPDAET